MHSSESERAARASSRSAGDHHGILASGSGPRRIVRLTPPWNRKPQMGMASW